MEGFYTVQFVGVQGWGTGVAVYIGGHVFGGDSAVMFTGKYDRQGDAVTVQLHVKQIAPGLMNTMGRNEFDLDLAGTVEGDKIKLAGNIPGTELRLKATLAKQSELPVRG
jgi:T3SS negative regulator,GrlR